MKKLILTLLVLPFGVFANERDDSLTSQAPFNKTCYSASGVINCGNGTGSYYSTGCFDTAQELSDYIAALTLLICPPPSEP